jgi:hypothetical protein
MPGLAGNLTRAGVKPSPRGRPLPIVLASFCPPLAALLRRRRGLPEVRQADLANVRTL